MKFEDNLNEFVSEIKGEEIKLTLNAKYLLDCLSLITSLG
jgi:DNA polymerase III sliding clamp (beta) subunit (PCNA family)